ncbi:ROK family transcriptional regulator [Mesorhizobium sp. B2-4-2]|nr:ROK family transcriptional regulator [Mesorhizobium sp. B2-4-2]
MRKEKNPGMLTLHTADFEDARQRDCARVIASLHEGGGKSRATLAAELDMTSMAISRAIADLVGRGIIKQSVGQVSGRGRPPAQIVLNPGCAGATVLLVSSQELVGVLVDFRGSVLARQTAHVPSDADSARMTATMRDLVAGLLGSCPSGMRHVGTSVAVSGIVDVKTRTWILTSRWPNVRDFDVGKALDGITPRVFLFRQLDVELSARYAVPGMERLEGAFILHWGWGIGLAYRGSDDAPMRQGGPFGEIGHWRFNVLKDRPCGCGNRGCLETAASLSALLPVIREIYPWASGEEELLSSQIETMELTDIPEIRVAVDLMARALGNACRLLFPEKVFITGPFTCNAGLYELLRSRFEAEGLIGTLRLPTLISDRSSLDYVVQGAAQPLHEIAVCVLLGTPQGKPNGAGRSRRNGKRQRPMP